MVNGMQVPSTDQLFWAGYSSLVYLPSTVGPAGLTKSGLPVGYQAIAASGRDKTAPAFSRLVEKETKDDIANLGGQLTSVERELKSIRRDLDDLREKVENVMRWRNGLTVTVLIGNSCLE
jgi:hypothetical protein